MIGELRGVLQVWLQRGDGWQVVVQDSEYVYEGIVEWSADGTTAGAIQGGWGMGICGSKSCGCTERLSKRFLRGGRSVLVAVYRPCICFRRDRHVLYQTERREQLLKWFNPNGGRVLVVYQTEDERDLVTSCAFPDHFPVRCVVFLRTNPRAEVTPLNLDAELIVEELSADVLQSLVQLLREVCQLCAVGMQICVRGACGMKVLIHGGCGQWRWVSEECELRSHVLMSQIAMLRVTTQFARDSC